MPRATLLAMELIFGLRVPARTPDTGDDDGGGFVDPLEDAERLIAGALQVPLAWSDDLELGGAFLEYAPRPVPETGIAGVRVHANNMRGELWSAPHRRDLTLVAEVAIRSPSLLDAGRLVEAAHARAGERAVLTSYVVAPGTPSEGRAELWRAHGALFTTDDAGARRWTPERSAVGDDIRWDASAVAPVHLGHVTFAVRAPDLDGALAAVSAVFPVAFAAAHDPDLGGDYLEHVSGDGSRLLLRRNAVGPFAWLFEDHKDVAFLLDVTLRTQSLLDLGRLAFTLEASGAFTPLAYRAIGDLVHDRVPRVLLG